MSAPDEIGAGSLKLIVFDAPADAIAQATACLRRHVRDEDMRSIAPAALIIYSHASPADVRDWLAPLLLDGEPVLVTEFERWSSRGDAVDRRWLLRRGH